MFKSLSLSLLLTLAAAAAPALAADPTPSQVYEAARNGHLAEAQQMITQVLRDHPQSAEAHYVAAEVNARAGNLALARQELDTARRLEPGLPFANPNSVQALERQLQGAATDFATGTGRPARAFPWGWLLLLLGGLGLLWSLLRRRAQQPVYRTYPGAPAPTTTAYGPNNPGYGPGGPGYGTGPGVVPPGGTAMPGRGSGLMGGLAGGLAAGAGLAAGEELIHRLGDRPEGGVVPDAGASEPDPNNPGMGGQDFGVDDGSSWDDGSSGGGDGGGGGDDWS
jgi:uncharacterized protein